MSAVYLPAFSRLLPCSVRDGHSHLQQEHHLRHPAHVRQLIPCSICPPVCVHSAPSYSWVLRVSFPFSLVSFLFSRFVPVRIRIQINNLCSWELIISYSKKSVIPLLFIIFQHSSIFQSPHVSRFLSDTKVFELSSRMTNTNTRLSGLWNDNCPRWRKTGRTSVVTHSRWAGSLWLLLLYKNSTSSKTKKRTVTPSISSSLCFQSNSPSILRVFVLLTRAHFSKKPISHPLHPPFPFVFVFPVNLFLPSIQLISGYKTGWCPYSVSCFWPANPRSSLFLPPFLAAEHVNKTNAESCWICERVTCNSHNAVFQPINKFVQSRK